MAKEIHVETFIREMIKPSSSTPQHLGSLQISLFDQLAPNIYIPLLLFYPNSRHHNPIETALKRSQCLRESLSKTLTHFYPLAGRLRNNLCVECNNEGAEFVEARVRCSMSEILREPDLQELKKLLPVETEAKQSAVGGCLVLVQASIFDCGGIAVGLSVSHKLVDGSTLSAFLDTWAKKARDLPVTEPEFCRASKLFPPLFDLSNTDHESSAVEFVQDKCVMRRFVFEAGKIEALRAKLASEGVDKNPTRVEAVSGLIWKCALEASRSNSPEKLRRSIWCQNVNMRLRMVPPLGENVAGNLVGYFAATTEENEAHGKIDTKALVDKFKKAMKEVEDSFGKRVNDSKEVKRALEEFGKLIKNDELDNYNCTSWCRFQFYESDFGWGKPAWVSIASFGFKNCVLLTDTRDGVGVEAWLVLRETDMVLVESNKELLAFASVNPSVL